MASTPQRDARASMLDLYKDSRDRLLRYLRVRLESEDDARELAQEAYLRLIRVDRHVLIRDPQAYLFRIAKNLVHELYSSRHFGGAGGVNLDDVEALDPPLEETADRTAQCRAVERVLDELSPKCQAVLLMYWRLDMTQQEIADKLQMSRSMVQKYHSLGLARCRKRLRRFGTKQFGSSI